VNEAAAAAKNYSLDSLVTRALATRVDVRAQSARADAAKQDVKAAQASRWPTVSLTGGYSTAYSSANTLAFADQLGQRRGGSVGVGVSIPLFDKGSTAVAVQRARIAEDNANLALDTERQTVALEVRRAYLDFTAAKERLVASDAQQKAAALAVKAALDRYQVGASTLLEVTQARAGLVQAESALVSARYNLVFQQSLMQYYTGELDPKTVVLGG
jgi:outer membrane protein